MGSPVAVLVGDRTFQRYAVGSPSALTVVDTSKGVDTVRSIEGRLRPRWVLWSADPALRPFVAAGIRPARSWDIAEAHRVLHGGWRADARDRLGGSARHTAGSGAAPTHRGPLRVRCGHRRTR